MAGAMASAMKKAAGGKGNDKAEMLAMQAMLEKMFDGAVPTLRKILGDEHLVFVRATSTVREASEVMATARKGVLVMDDRGKELLGISSLPRTFCLEWWPRICHVTRLLVLQVMTPNPDCVGPDYSVGCFARDARSQVFALARSRRRFWPSPRGGGRNGAAVDHCRRRRRQGMARFFQGAMDARGDDFSETSSQHSYGSKSFQADCQQESQQYYFIICHGWWWPL